VRRSRRRCTGTRGVDGRGSRRLGTRGGGCARGGRGARDADASGPRRRASARHNQAQREDRRTHRVRASPYVRRVATRTRVARTSSRMRGRLPQDI
jgi:hypothetical protein